MYKNVSLPWSFMDCSLELWEGPSTPFVQTSQVGFGLKSHKDKTERRKTQGQDLMLRTTDCCCWCRSCWQQHVSFWRFTSSGSCPFEIWRGQIYGYFFLCRFWYGLHIARLLKWDTQSDSSENEIACFAFFIFEKSPTSSHKYQKHSRQDLLVHLAEAVYLRS